MQWSNRTPGVLARPALLTPQAETGVREMAIRRLQTPCDILVESVGESPTGGVGQAVTVILASVSCDVEPMTLRSETPPAGFETKTLYHVYLPSTQAVPSSARIRVPGWLQSWQAGANVVLGEKRVATGEWGNGRFYECIQAGTTGTTEPLWDTRQGAPVSDGSALWKEAGDAFTLEVIFHDGERSRDGLVVVLAQLLK